VAVDIDGYTFRNAGFNLALFDTRCAARCANQSNGAVSLTPTSETPLARGFIVPTQTPKAMFVTWQP